MATSEKSIINKIVSTLIDGAKKDENARKDLAERMAKMMNDDPQFRATLFKAVFSNKVLSKQMSEFMLQELLD